MIWFSRVVFDWILAVGFLFDYSIIYVEDIWLGKKFVWLALTWIVLLTIGGLIFVLILWLMIGQFRRLWFSSFGTSTPPITESG
jgi:hypothetical protein